MQPVAKQILGITKKRREALDKLTAQILDSADCPLNGGNWCLR